MKLEGWKAVVVLIAAIIEVISFVITIPLFIALGFVH